ncbi:ABC transporter six-transmembrane domain-containing protein [Pantoea sp. PNA 03-3]|uniref:ABC transporter six-transmembrane domain-containing protein n=1 Tax=Pantoea sp. PNA 03-3 TaxID=2135460 RepID=UPI0021057C1E|nr:ABC transporter six-transmembrane domain-containing protein [Pantoea sp. PNA 03-3]
MLLAIAFWTGVGCPILLLSLACFLPGFSHKNKALSGWLNNRLEKEISLPPAQRAGQPDVTGSHTSPVSTVSTASYQICLLSI